MCGGDGITAHNDAYKQSVWGGVMAGPTGESIRTLVASGPRLLGTPLLANPLLAGKSPAELRATLADLKAAEGFIDLLADKGVIVAAEVREPLPTVKGVAAAFGGLLGGQRPDPIALTPAIQLLVIVPGGGAKADVFHGTLRLLMKQGDNQVEAFEASGRKGFQFAPPAAGGPPFALYSAWWAEGEHFVFYAGNRRPAAVVAEIRANVAAGGITGHPLFARCQKTGDFTRITRGFIDTGKMVKLAKDLAGPFVPGLRERLDGTGLGNLKAVVFASGFSGKESRALYEFDLPGERKGIAKVLKNVPLGLADLPPMPPDVSRFSALRLDPAAAYDASLSVGEALALYSDFGVEGDAGKSPAAVIAARKAYMMREVDKFLGISVTADLLPHLGDKLVVFQSPSEGLQVFGTVVCVSVTDAAKVKSAAARIQGALEAFANSPVKVRKKTLAGVDYHELYSRGFAAVTPTYAVVGEWLVVSMHPQAVQGVILRAKGDLEKWKPDAATAKRLAAMPAGGCGLQFCNPKSTAGNLCCIGPLFLSTFGNLNRGQGTESDYNPIDMGLIPNAHELCRHLFPNLTVTHDDGKTIRIHVNESFSLPLEVVGLEPFVFLGTLGLRF